MNIVFEGPDNTGKSTLIQQLQEKINWPTIPSEGPEKYPGEIDIRITRLNMHIGVIFDRHSAVSESIYAFLREAPGPSPMSIMGFYSMKPSIVYCRPVAGRGMRGHRINKGVDTQRHVAGVTENYERITRMYDEWALEHAHFIYRIGDDPDQLIQSIEGRIKR